MSIVTGKEFIAKFEEFAPMELAEAGGYAADAYTGAASATGEPRTTTFAVGLRGVGGVLECGVSGAESASG